MSDQAQAQSVGRLDHRFPQEMVDRVTGRTLYLDDIQVAGQLHGAFVRLDAPRATLDNIEIAAAAAAEGVVRVFTSADFAASGGVPRFGPVQMDQPLLAERVTRYSGEPVALVVAKTRAQATSAAKLVEVAHQALPGFHTVDGALAAEPLHRRWEGESRSPHPAESNVMGVWDYAWGNLEAAEAASTLVVENTYTAPFAHHYAIETYGAIAIPGPSGVKVLSTIQHPFIERRVIADVLGLPLSMVDVRAVQMGGSFGGKGYPKLGPVAAVFSRILGQPLKIVISAEESFLTAQREASEIRIRSGFNQNYELTFQDIEADFLIGAYADISARVVSKSGLHATGPYRTPAARIRARAIFTSTPPTTAFRGFGAPHLAMAIEGQLSDAARRLSVDPCQLRLTNMKAKGDPTVEHETPVDGDWANLMTMACREIGWDEPLPPGRGRGVAFGMKSCVPGTTSDARVRVHADGTVTAYVGTSEMGQGAVVSFARLLANALGVQPERVTLVMGDTATAPYDALTASSRSLVHMGNALLDAVDRIKAQILDIVQNIHDPEAAYVDVGADRLTAGAWSGSLRELLAAKYGKGCGELVATGTFSAVRDGDHPLGGPTPFFEVVATAVEVSVDPATGMIDIHRLVHVTDAGKVHNHARAKGLDEGGLIMGLGLALSEQLIYDEGGRLRNGSSLDYRIPTIGDIPAVSISLFQENGDGPGPAGAKGMAEGGLLAIAPALAAAIFDCTGVHLRHLPFTAEQVWLALQDKTPTS